MAAFKETHARSVTKAVVWRVVVIISDAIIVYAVTRRLDLTATFVTLTNLSSTFLYYFHERAWNGITWGKKQK